LKSETNEEGSGYLIGPAAMLNYYDTFKHLEIKIRNNKNPITQMIQKEKYQKILPRKCGIVKYHGKYN